ncbi:hypothetical protein RIF29_07245 [Crotalaria pallida]|uniref:RNA polymerase III RPC4 n=1 Tax=Crotalaria pallida TaxID=3830 RepID=A0AAN9J547_CROPI
MDSDSKANAPHQPRKNKYKPVAKPKKTRPQPKTEQKTEEFVDHDDKDRAKDLLQLAKENEMKHRQRFEKKVAASQIAFGLGGESTSTRSYAISKGGSNINGNQSSALNAAREKEYKEPWDYYSNYPTTLPLRRPYSGNPEFLDEEEFGEVAESRGYDENLSNPVTELGLLEENLEANMFLISLPATLPIIKGSARGQDVAESSKPPRGAKNAAKPYKLNEIPRGIMGKLYVYKSGATKMKLGDTLYDVSPGMNCGFSQDLIAMNTAQKHCCTVGEISKQVTITPDIDSVIDNLAHL